MSGGGVPACWVRWGELASPSPTKLNPSGETISQRRETHLERRKPPAPAILGRKVRPQLLSRLRGIRDIRIRVPKQLEVSRPIGRPVSGVLVRGERILAEGKHAVVREAALGCGQIVEPVRGIHGLPDGEETVDLTRKAVSMTRAGDLPQLNSERNSPVMDPKHRIKRRNRHTAHVTRIRIVTTETANIHMIFVVQILKRPRVVLQNLGCVVRVLALDEHARRREGAIVAVRAGLDHGQAGAHLVLADLVEVAVEC